MAVAAEEAGGVAGHKRSSSMDGATLPLEGESAPSSVLSGYAKKAVPDDKLAELALLDPKRAKSAAVTPPKSPPQPEPPHGCAAALLAPHLAPSASVPLPSRAAQPPRRPQLSLAPRPSTPPSPAPAHLGGTAVPRTTTPAQLLAGLLAPSSSFHHCQGCKLFAKCLLPYPPIVW
ncbi:early nodulin-like protein 18 [Miscanthus floridulus]|uniref:early nodulin-like protein 18 n=1 Tax=Miscanthus floridulus TaxID=154761 RepID=UPI003458158F